MKTIILHTASVDNGGQRREAGEHITVGGDAREINQSRAKVLVDDGSAVEVAQPAKGKSTPSTSPGEAE